MRPRPTRPPGFSTEARYLRRAGRPTTTTVRADRVVDQELTRARAIWRCLTRESVGIDNANRVERVLRLRHLHRFGLGRTRYRVTQSARADRDERLPRHQSRVRPFRSLLGPSDDDARDRVAPIVMGGGEIPDAVDTWMNVDKVVRAPGGIESFSLANDWRPRNVRAELVVWLRAGVVRWRRVSTSRPRGRPTPFNAKNASLAGTSIAATLTNLNAPCIPPTAWRLLPAAAGPRVGDVEHRRRLPESAFRCR